MARNFTDDDRDKNVVTSEGNRIGTIDDVNDDRATVKRDRDKSLTDKVKDMLGWDDDDSNEIRNEHVDTVNDDEVRLRDRR
ncbi:hypothetical protein HUG10_02130 [Halorarum halophilum]|uniref:PRC-barrel domain-containing protein n=1 Tax=Halorarum halophilum TaxID=2743090 RepID=A0A7D5GVU3_9EURY|nr:hypothetical protein [Halobaculum halophilum]QLG26409.1 hypothetical protein HUG10_02130 [Halobaculum halophilum]